MSDQPAVTDSPLPTNPAEAPTSRRRLWVILALAVLLIAGGGLAMAIMASAGTNASAADPTTSATNLAPTSAAPSPSATATSLPSVQGVPRLAMPKTLLGRPASTDRNLKATTQKMLKGYEFDPAPLTQIGAAYGSPAKRNQVIALAFSISLNDPAAFLAESSFPVRNPQQVDAGPAGGAAVCGEAENIDPKSAYCLWADENSLGILIFVGAKPATVGPLLAKARAEIQIPS